ncbi:MAG TPA: hypothetical protein VFT80_14810 [Actinomycetota bacterium]|nr:hypothetical protein [Actinomycetota bacterium]
MRILRVVAVLALVGAFALGATPALATRDARGSCSGGPSEWRLTVGREDDRTLRIRYRIEDGEPDQAWQLFISDDGVRVYAGTKASNDEGRVRVRRLTADRPGRDRIEAAGVNLETGESCSGRVTVR